MLIPRHKEYLLILAALLTWAAVSGVAGYALWERDRIDTLLSAFLPLALVNLAAMWVAMSDEGAKPSILTRFTLGIQLASALLIGWIVPISFMPIYTVVWIAMVAGVTSFRTALWLLAGVLGAWWLIIHIGWRESGALLTVLLFGTFHLFAMLTIRNARLAEQARDDLQTRNSELRATQHLLSEAVRQGERTRIARDLHDLVGHHLTALSINLQIAERLTEGEALERVSEARAIARLLLSDVREAVTTLRNEARVALAPALNILAEGVHGIDVVLDLPDNLAIDDVEIADTLLRCTQEALTNTLRHSGATKTCIKLTQTAAEIRLEIRDNGHVSRPLHEGNGLTGMRERITVLRGTLDIDTGSHSLGLVITLPLESKS